MSERITLQKFPPTEQVSRLAKLVILGGADLDSLEEKLYDATATKGTTFNDSTSSHESKKFLYDVKNAADSRKRRKWSHECHGAPFMTMEEIKKYCLFTCM